MEGPSGVDDVRERFERSRFHSDWLGLRLDRVEPGEVDVALEVGPQHLNLAGTLHGGMIATLADTATGLALRTTLEPGTRFVTTQLNVVLLSPGGEGTVLAKGRVVRSGRRFGYSEADVVGADGKLLARGTATFTIVRSDDQ